MWACLKMDREGFMEARYSMVVFRDGKLVGGDGRPDATRMLEQWEQLMKGNEKGY